MMKYLVIILINIMLLTELKGASRWSHNVDGTTQTHLQDNSSANVAGQERRELLIATLGELTILAKQTVQLGVMLFKNTLKELGNLPEDKRTALQNNIIIMSEFVKTAGSFETLETYESLQQLFLHMQSLGLILKNVALAATAEPAITLKEAFQKCGANEFDTEFEKRLIEFFSEFDHLFESFWQKLTKNEQKSLPALKAWRDEFKAEPNLVRKHAKLEQLFLILMEGN